MVMTFFYVFGGLCCQVADFANLLRVCLYFVDVCFVFASVDSCLSVGAKENRVFLPVFTGRHC